MQKSRRFILALAVIAAAVLFVLYYMHYIRSAPLRIEDFDISLYKKATVSQKTLPMNIASEGGGVYFVSTAPQKNISVLDISGEMLAGKATLRIKYDDLPPTYGNLAGPMRVWLEPYNRLELLIYNDEPFEFRLDEINLKTRSDGLTQEDFKELVLTEISGLRDALGKGDELAAARLLLHWSARVSDLSVGKIKRNALMSAISSLSVQQIYKDIWLADDQGGSCGAFAIFYDKLLKLFGVNSFTVDMGYDGARELNFTHVITVVAQEKDGKWKFYIFDPTVDGTFVDKSGNFIDIESVLQTFDRDALRITDAFSDAEECLPRDRINHNRTPILVEKEYPYCIKTLYIGWEKRARKNNSPYADRLASYQTDPQASMDFDMLQSRIYSIGLALVPEARQAFVDLMTRYGVAVP